MLSSMCKPLEGLIMNPPAYYPPTNYPPTNSGMIYAPQPATSLYGTYPQQATSPHGYVGQSSPSTYGQAQVAPVGPPVPPAGSAPSADRPSFAVPSWYFCADSKNYYPYVKDCKSAWQAEPLVWR